MNKRSQSPGLLDVPATDLDVLADENTAKRVKLDHEITNGVEEGTGLDLSSATGYDSSDSDDVSDILDLISMCEGKHHTIQNADDNRRASEHQSSSTSPSTREPPISQQDESDDPLTSVEQSAALRLDLKVLGPQSFLEKYLLDKAWTVRHTLKSFGILLPADLDDVEDTDLIQVLRIYVAREYSRRERLPHVTTFDDVVSLLKSCSKILVITGAGISTSLGIPDFRSKDGIYSRLEKYNLTDPQEMFDIHVFRHDPSIFFDFARDLLPDARGYSPTHAFIRLLQDKGKLLTQYTQNIDDIESTAGIEEGKLVQCHGSFQRATCLTCGLEVPGTSIFEDIKAGRVPLCTVCHAPSPPRSVVVPLSTLPGLDASSALSDTTSHQSRKKKKKKEKKRRPRIDEWEGGSSSSKDEDYGEDNGNGNNDGDTSSFGVLKPNITFFGEQLAPAFRKHMERDRGECDMVLCIGTSLRVAPVAEIPNLVPVCVPQVFVSRDAAHKDVQFDVEVLGDGDDIMRRFAEACGWLEEFDRIVERGKR